MVWGDYYSSSTTYSSGLPNFKTAAENEGVSTTDMDACTNATSGNWLYQSGPVKKCLMELLLSTLAKDNWALITAHSHPLRVGNSMYSNDNAYYFTRTNYTTPTVAVSTVPAPASAQMEHKAVFWSNSVADFKTSAENEGVSTTDMEACTSTSYWSLLTSLEQKCLVELLMSTLAKDNWTLIQALSEHGSYFFTRPVQTS